MARLGLFSVVAFVMLSGTLFAADEMKSSLVPAPEVTTIVGKGLVSLEAAHWPDMKSVSDNDSCDTKVAELSDACKGDCRAFYAIPGLMSEFAVPKNYSENANIVVTWVLRVEGVAGQCPRPWVELECTPYHGTSTCTFRDGEVTSRLYVDGQPIGMEANMTVPGVGAVSVTNPNPPPPPTDPTHTGSAVLKPSLFPGGRFPDTIKIEVRWRNDSSMNVRSNAEQHSMAVMFVPVTAGS